MFASRTVTSGESKEHQGIGPAKALCLDVLWERSGADHVNVNTTQEYYSRARKSPRARIIIFFTRGNLLARPTVTSEENDAPRL